MSVADPHAQVLYAVEHAVMDPVARRYGSVAEARSHVEDLVAGDWFALRWPDQAAPTVVRRGRGATWSLATRACTADHEDGTILLADLHVGALLHELAHLCVGIGHGHDDRFVVALLVLVRREMGAHVYGALRAELVAARRWPFLDDELSGLEG